MRIVLGQSFSVEHLMPLALHVLERNPLAEGDYYPGDLLVSVKRQPEEFWQTHPEFRERLIVIHQLLIKRIHDIWNERKEEAWELYGATITADRSVSDKEERDMLKMAKEYVEHYGRTGNEFVAKF